MLLIVKKGVAFRKVKQMRGDDMLHDLGWDASERDRPVVEGRGHTAAFVDRNDLADSPVLGHQPRLQRLPKYFDQK